MDVRGWACQHNSMAHAKRAWIKAWDDLFWPTLNLGDGSGKHECLSLAGHLGDEVLGFYPRGLTNSSFVLVFAGCWIRNVSTVQRTPAVKFPRRLLVTLVAFGCILPWLSTLSWGAPPSVSEPTADASSSSATEDVLIPGPLRSFLRMAGISQKASPEEVLPLLGHNVSSQGFEVGGRPTEFLILLARYVQQARELVTLASPNGVIRVSNCEEAQPLLRILGYRPRPDCGRPSTFLETADAERAFLTIDSGFPLPDLEEALQGAKTFEYPYTATHVPALSSPNEWVSASKKNDRQSGRDLLDTLLRDPAVARLYWSFSRLNPETRAALQHAPGIKKLVPFSTTLSFYGSHLSVRSGKVIVPGGTASEAAWKDLVGASPDSPGDFLQKLLAKDKGWLAAYFDVLARVNATQQAHFTNPERLHRYYDALHAHDASVDATTGSYRPAPELLLLVTRLRWNSDGEPYVPGNLEMWKDILRQKSDSKLVREVGKRSSHITTADQLVQTMFALSRANTDSSPLHIFLALSEIESRRTAQQHLSPETMRLLARRFEELSYQYRTFSEFPELNDASVKLFVETAQSLDGISNSTVRGNALGTFQANVGLWQILARQGEIPSAQQNESWQKTIRPFAKIRSAAQTYEAGESSLEELFQTTAGKARVSQEELVELIAGPQQSTSEGKKMREELANRIRAILDEQRLVSLDTVLALGDALKQKEQAKPIDDSLVSLAGELREFEMPQPIFTRGERTKWAAGVYNNRHTELQMQADVARVLKGQASHSQLEEARGQLASFLRDILVGLNYAYYEPPGAQALHNNPLFVRSHDFAGETVSGIKGVWQAPQLFGEGSPAGGGAHLVGSLADLPFVLAELEQDFIAPENVQALIWREFVPGLMTSAVLPRWWGVSRNELHAITLYQRSGEELLTASTNDEGLRKRVMAILSDRMTPQEAQEIETGLAAGKVSEILPRMAPADTFYLAAEFRRKFPGDNTAAAATQELRKLAEQYPDELTWERLSRDFGVPHPTLAQTYARELLNVPPLPAFSGYSSRLLAESWDSANLYWARLADETGYSPEALNRLVPDLTRRMVEKIFATNFEDWPALLRALRETGEDFKQGKVAMAAPSTSTALVDVVPGGK
jgi:hypothetical protein